MVLSSTAGAEVVPHAVPPPIKLSLGIKALLVSKLEAAGFVSVVLLSVAIYYVIFRGSKVSADRAAPEAIFSDNVHKVAATNLQDVESSASTRRLPPSDYQNCAYSSFPASALTGGQYGSLEVVITEEQGKRDAESSCKRVSRSSSESSTITTTGAGLTLSSLCSSFSNHIATPTVAPSVSLRSSIASESDIFVDASSYDSCGKSMRSMVLSTPVEIYFYRRGGAGSACSALVGDQTCASTAVALTYSVPTPPRGYSTLGPVMNL